MDLLEKKRNNFIFSCMFTLVQLSSRKFHVVCQIWITFSPQLTRLSFQVVDQNSWEQPEMEIKKSVHNQIRLQYIIVTSLPHLHDKKQKKKKEIRETNQ